MTHPQTLASLNEELKSLQTEQEHAMPLSVYVGMSKEAVLRYEGRQARISEIYVSLSALSKTYPLI